MAPVAASAASHPLTAASISSAHTSQLRQRGTGQKKFALKNKISGKNECFLPARIWPTKFSLMILPKITKYCKILQNIAKYCQILQKIAKYCQILPTIFPPYCPIMIIEGETHTVP